jgi:hypothetical protein
MLEIIVLACMFAVLVGGSRFLKQNKTSTSKTDTIINDAPSIPLDPLQWLEDHEFDALNDSSCPRERCVWHNLAFLRFQEANDLARRFNFELIAPRPPRRELRVHQCGDRAEERRQKDQCSLAEQEAFKRRLYERSPRFVGPINQIVGRVHKKVCARVAFPPSI